MNEAPFISQDVLDVAEEVVNKWIGCGYTPEEIHLITEASPTLKEAILFTIMDKGFDAQATMHYDDPSFIEFHKELDDMLSHINL